ncbi:putative EF-hand domain, mechanosensitive ion channel MscS, EF-hand domain pair [Septoria linicola]|nr:putative EF-hand domain, mechanosensitive ion channel MscS, EF-hand domain pair [Septoria linicola]
MTTLKPLDTGLASVGFRPVSYSAEAITPTPVSHVHHLRSPTGPTSAFPKTPVVSAYPKTPIGESPIRMLGRRTTTRNFDVDQTEALAYDGEDDVASRFGKYLRRVHSTSIITRYALYILPVAILLAIPLIMLSCPPYDMARADGIRLLGLFIWIEIIWLALWISKLLAQAVPIVFQAACGLISAGMRKYSLILKSLEIPLSFLFWTIAAFGSTNIITVFDKADFYQQYKGQWVRVLNQVCKASIIAAGIFTVEKTIIQLISIAYYQEQYARKIRESKRLIRLLDMLYDASRSLFPEFGRDFQHEDSEIHRENFIDLRAKLDKKGIGIGSKLLGDVHRVRDKVTAAFGVLASDVTGQQIFSTANAHSIVSKALETERASKALARRLWLSLCASGKEAIYKEDILEVLGPGRECEAEEIFDILDRDGNGDVSLEEMTMLIVNCGTERKDRASSIQDISSAIAVLDKILTIIVVAAIAFIYAIFFSKALANKSTQLWAAINGLSFMIGGTVTEFIACCIFLFVKHPYDVGDRVNINNPQDEESELIVKHISLMYTIFKRMDTDALVQIPHNIANTLWVENVTRSKAMKERITIGCTWLTKMDDLLALRKEMGSFVNAPSNSHDFMSEVDIELRTIVDLRALEIRIEIRHKSNWANEQVRLHRRNKFMCALLEAFRKVGMERPGDAPGPDNPTYVVELKNEETVGHQIVKSEKQEAMKTFTRPQNLVPEGVSPAQALVPGLKKRSPYRDDMGRRPSIWSPM